VAVHRLFENIEVDWRALSEPGQGEIQPASERRQGPQLSLATFNDEHLRSLSCVRALYRRAVARGIVGASEADSLKFLATVAYSLRAGRRPALLFRHLLRSHHFPATLEDEDRAVAALKRERAREQGRRHWLRLKPAESSPDGRPPRQGNPRVR
jgi:hypothetical protein